MLVSNVEPPTDFRLHDVAYIMQTLRARRSCALIGINGIGKTSLLRHLETKSIREHYLRESARHFTFLFIDSHELSAPSALAYYRRMALALEPLLRSAGVFPTDNVFSATTEPMMQEVLFKRVEALLECEGQQVLVFFFDEFDVALTEVEPHFLRVLQALRRHARGRVCYVIASSNLPALLCDLQSRQIVSDMFAELFDGNVCGIKPFEERDAHIMIEHMLILTGQELSQALRQRCLDIVGAHPGILKSVVAALVEGRASIHERHGREHIIARLLGDRSTANRCELVWNSLSEIEQRCLRLMSEGILTESVLQRQASSQQLANAIQHLLLKGVLIELRPGATYRCFSPLLAAYIARNFPIAKEGLRLDGARRQVWVDGVMRPERLSKKEFKLLSYLASRAGEVCTREETNLEVYGQPYTSVRDAGRLDALVEHTRKRIGDNQREPRFLQTVHGVGHCLKEYLGPL